MTGDGADPLYYVWTTVWSWLVAGVVLVSLVVSFTSGSSGLGVHLTQAGQVILLAFLVWAIPAALTAVAVGLMVSVVLRVLRAQLSDVTRWNR